MPPKKHEGVAAAAILDGHGPGGGAAGVAGENVSGQCGAAKRHGVAGLDEAVRLYGLEAGSAVGARPAACGESRGVALGL